MPDQDRPRPMQRPETRPDPGTNKEKASVPPVKDKLPPPPPPNRE